MSQTPPQNAARSVDGQMYLFRKPELITRDAHGDLGITKPNRAFAFADTARAVPITLSEITTAIRYYPVIFSSEENPVPLAVLGLMDDINLFVEETGDWSQDYYVPGYIRRYPFALATDRDSNSDNPRMAIIVDADYEGITQNAEVPFFEGADPSAPMKQAMEFCQNYERDRLQTMRFAEELAKYDLVTNQMAQYTPDSGEAQAFARYVGVDENKLRDLADDKYLELRKNNILPILYAQLMSMGNWRTLLDRRARRFNLTGEAVIKPLPKV